MVFQRNLKIKCGDIGENPVTLLLCFQVPDPSKLYTEQFPVAWRVIEFTGEGNENLNAMYNNQLFVANPQSSTNNFVKPNQWISIDPGQQTTFEKKGQALHFTTPVKGSGKLIIAENATQEKRNFTIGMVEGNDPVPLLYFSGVGSGSSLVAQFTPKLQAYIVSNYQETSVLKGAIQTMKPFWTQDLAKYDDQTVNLVFQKDHATGAYSIDEA